MPRRRGILCICENFQDEFKGPDGLKADRPRYQFVTTTRQKDRFGDAFKTERLGK